MFAPPQEYKKCPWWHKLFRRFRWFRCRCGPIEFKSITLPIIDVNLPSLDLDSLADVQPLNKLFDKE